MPLVITRRIGERVRVRLPGGVCVWVRPVTVEPGRVRIQFEAPREVEILREEIIDEREARATLPPS